jgi:DNA repair protein RAD5
MPQSRYIGSFGAEGWATRSGTKVLSSGEKVRVERQKIAPKATVSRRGGGKAKIGGVAGGGLPSATGLMSIGTARPNPLNKRADIVVRFTNSRGEEVGRLPQDVAAWVSTLLDQKICEFEGVCVFAPERLRINDTIYLQLRCALRRRAFENATFTLPDSNRATGIFEAKETDEEKDLRLRQVALVKLLQEIGLQPSRTTDAAEKQKRQGLLRAVELGEQAQKDRSKTSSKAHDAEHGGSSPPSQSEQDAEDGGGAELEQNQLDTLYKKAQSFDFDTPAAEPADTFALSLRHYQKQALHWMMGKEKNEKPEHKEQSMHPLWEEYSWPTRDADDVIIKVEGLEHFYVNLYSGELSLDFPVQEQNCLGGILADGTSRMHLWIDRFIATSFDLNLTD